MTHALGLMLLTAVSLCSSGVPHFSERGVGASGALAQKPRDAWAGAVPGDGGEASCWIAWQGQGSQRLFTSIALQTVILLLGLTAYCTALTSLLRHQPAGLLSSPIVPIQMCIRTHTDIRAHMQTDIRTHVYVHAHFRMQMHIQQTHLSRLHPRQLLHVVRLRRSPVAGEAAQLGRCSVGHFHVSSLEKPFVF